MRHNLAKALLSLGLAAVAFLTPTVQVLASEIGYWELDEKKNRWMYAIDPGEYLYDQWLNDEGKEYYLDANGYMKTGWFTDKEDGNKYYLGEDGAKCYNCFTADDKYVGPEGTQLELFDKYRKAAKKELKAFKKGDYAFLLEDFNNDGYRDYAIMSREKADEGQDTAQNGQTSAQGETAAADGSQDTSIAASLRQVLQVSIWDPEQQKFIIAAEADLDETGTRHSWLAGNEMWDTAWLVMADSESGCYTVYSLEEEGAYFKQWYDFSIGQNEWRDRLYFLDGYEEDKDLWEQELKDVQEDAGESMNSRFVPLTEDAVDQAVDCAPTEDEIFLWTE